MNPAEKCYGCEQEVDEIMERIKDDEAFLERYRQIKVFTAEHTNCGILCFHSELLPVPPFFNAMNAPLSVWLAIILLTVSCWSFSTGALSNSWTGS